MNRNDEYKNNPLDVHICSASSRILPQHQQDYDDILKVKNDKHRTVLQAAFWTSKLWPSNSKIRIAFINDSDPQCGVNGYRCNTAKDLTNVSKNHIHSDGCQSLEKHFKETLNMPKNNLHTYVPEADPLQIEFDKNPTKIKEMIKRIFNERWLPLIDLDVKFVKDVNEANVRIDFQNGTQTDKPGGAWSLVGTDCLQKTDKTSATVNFQWFDVGTVLHEFGHMLGMIHEHQNPRGETIDWNVPVVDYWAQTTQGWDASTTARNIINHYKKSQINGSDFDSDSIMLYFFPSCLLKEGNGTHQNLRLSKTDIKWMLKMYPKSGNQDADYYYDKFYGKFYGSETSKQGILKGDTGLYIFIGCTILGLIIVGILLYIRYCYHNSESKSSRRATSVGNYTRRNYNGRNYNRRF